MKETKAKQKQKKRSPILTGLGIFAILTVSVLVFVCVERTNYYKTHFLPNTYINGMNCSELDVQVVGGMLEQKAKEYELAILGQDEMGSPKEIGRVTAEEIALELEDGMAVANELLSQQESIGWIRAVLGKEEQHLNAVHAVIFDEGRLETLVKQFDAFLEENMSVPVDAYISEYKEELGGFTIVPEILGTQLHIDEALSSIKTVINAGSPLIDLAEQGCYEKPKVFSDDKKLAEDLAQINKWLETKIKYDWNTVEVIVDREVIKDWIVTGEEEIRLDEDAVADFVKKKASECDSYGKNRTFVTSRGTTVSLPTGGFGWKTDRTAVREELISLVKEGAVTSMQPVYSNTAPVQGMNDIGSSYVEADLSNQHLYLYYKGQLVFETDFVSGKMNSTPDCVTPEGVFDITYKTKNAVLKGDDYETPVAYWMPFYGNYGMHDATWRNAFGGDIFLTGGSHGCINLPKESAETIYSYVYEGYPVICYY